MTQEHPVRRREPEHLLRLHNELDDLTTTGLSWKAGSILVFVVGSILLAAFRLGWDVGMAVEIGVISLAALAIVGGIGIAKHARIRSLRRAILELEQDTPSADAESS